MSVRIATDSIHLSLPHPSSSASAIIALQGATVISWKVHGEERLFLSKTAQLHGPAPIRGGIPIIFPQFASAPPDHPLADIPRHGFARSSRWSLSSSEARDDSIVTQFALGRDDLTSELREAFPYDFALIYTVTLSPSSLSCHLRVENLSPQSFPFHALLFSYIHLPDVTSGRIGGLTHLPYKDKARDGKQYVEEEERVGNLMGIDRVYMGIPPEIHLFHPPTSPILTLHTEGLTDLEVWNPGPDKEASMSDFESGGWKHMVTLEPGCVKSHLNLPSGEIWEASATYSIPS